MSRPGIDVDRLTVVAEDGVFWAMDWIPDTYGNSTINRYHLAFKSQRDAESFVKAAKKRVVQ